MIGWLIRASLSHRTLVLALAVAIALFGAWTYRQQTIDAYPDISAEVVTLITFFPGRAPEEVERQVTIPIELTMGSVPKLSIIRSRTIFGLSVVQLIFQEGTDSFFARQRVSERLDLIPLPPNIRPELGPLATAYGEVYRYQLASDGLHDPMELRTLNDWVVIPHLQRMPGVAEVINFGGDAKQFAVVLLPLQLERYGLTMNDIMQAIATNNANAGGSVLRRGDMSFVIRGRGTFQNVADIESTFVKTVGDAPIYLRDVAHVDLEPMLPNGIFSKDEIDDAVQGIVLMRRRENPSRVLAGVKEEVERLNRESLPPGVRIEPFYDREFLIESTLHTVTHSILTGVALVVLTLLIFLGSPGAAALVVLTIPFALLVALVLMYFTSIPIGLLSIGAIDFGILVDGSIIMVDNIVERLHPVGRKRVRDTILSAALEVQRPIFFSILIIIAAYFPLLTLTSIEGLLFRPMALTIVFALTGAAIFALFLVPPLASIILRHGYLDWENPLLSWSRPRYARILRGLLRHRWLTSLVALGIFVVTLGVVFPRLGTEFLPYLDEGVLWIRANFPEGTSLEQTAQFGKRLRQLVSEHPDVDFVTGQAGRNDSGTDPFPPSRFEMMVGPKPRDQWVSHTKQDLVRSLGDRLRAEFPTTRFNFTQPIMDSVAEDTNGTSANLAVEFSGADSDILLPLARRTRELLRAIPGAVDVNIEQEGPQPQLIINPDRALCARYDVRIEDVNQLINTALGGQPIGTLYDGDRRFDIVARFDRFVLNSQDQIERLPVFTAEGVPIPLSQVAKFEVADGQTMIARDSGRRRLTVRADIVGRDQGGFVAEAKDRFNAEIVVPEGYQVRWLGMFANLERARVHFAWVIPATIAIIFVILVVAFGSVREALVVLLAVPFAFLGGVLALYLRGMTLNVSSGVGFATLFGIAIMNGVVLVQWIDTLRTRGLDLDDAIVEGSLGRLRPNLMASLVAILGLLPASIATGLGSDVQRPLATVIVWGLVSSTILTLFIIPVFYRIGCRRTVSVPG